VAKASPGIRFNEHIEGDGPTVFAHACKMGLEGIVSKRKDSAYRSGRDENLLSRSAVRQPRGRSRRARRDEFVTSLGRNDRANLAPAFRRGLSE
jgi:hypothetical protein